MTQENLVRTRKPKANMLQSPAFYKALFVATAASFFVKYQDAQPQQVEPQPHVQTTEAAPVMENPIVRLYAYVMKDTTMDQRTRRLIDTPIKNDTLSTVSRHDYKML